MGARRRLRAEGRGQWRARLEELRVDEMERSDLEWLGKALDQHPNSLRGPTVGMALAERLLVVRTREGRPEQVESKSRCSARSSISAGNGTLC